MKISSMPAQKENLRFAGMAADGFVLWLLLIGFSLLWFWISDYRHLVRDEGRYAEIAREMFVSGDWITPRYNDVKYFEKPPLQAWMTALAYSLFGVGEWQARLWTSLTGFLATIAVGWTAARVFGNRAGWLATIALIANPMWVGLGHVNTLDMGLSAMLCGALCCLLLAQRHEVAEFSRRNWMLLCWVMMALAVLSKGLIGIALPGMVLVVYTLTTRDFSLWKRLYIVPGLLILLVIDTPWFVLVSLRNPEFPRFFFYHEHFERFTTDVHRREGPLWYFVPIALAGVLPWLAQVPAIFRFGWRDRSEPRENGFRPAWLIFLWVVVIFSFFSISHSKLSPYILPIFPAIAMLTGVALSKEKISRWKNQLLFMAILAASCFLLLPVLRRLGSGPYEHLQYANYSIFAAIGLVTLLVGILASRLLVRHDLEQSILSYGAAFFLAIIIFGAGHECLDRPLSGTDLAERVKPLLEPGVPFYAVRVLDQTMPFYLRRPMMMVEHAGELEFGIEQEPTKWAPTLEDFTARWQSASQAYALMRPDTYDTLRMRGLPMVELGHDEHRVIVARRFRVATTPAKRASELSLFVSPDSLTVKPYAL